ncbi:MAG: hypothetical protein QG639_602 [Patescibacteria group bacterium]|jgi:glycosyltransferase involved in cell wall biosynthesis|nr:hypothetical protein [Patescibacteria group bacterium]
MKVIPISDISGYKQAPNKFFNTERFAKRVSDNIVLLEGGFEKVRQWEQFNFSQDELKSIRSKKVCIIEAEEPNKFFLGDNPEEYFDQFYRVFTICPFTAEWLNKRTKTKRHVAICWPFNEEYAQKPLKKKYDIIYTGHLVSGILMKDLRAISQFNYRLVSNSEDPIVTDRGVGYQEKMKLIAQSKITLVHNLLYPKVYHLPNIWKTPGWQDNQALKLIPKWYEPWKWFSDQVLVPQQKSRVLEAAFGRSLILCRRDPFNVIERYFEPGKEFIYYDANNLAATVASILENYDDYKTIIDNAYNKAYHQYSIKAFVEKYLEPLS